MTMLSRRLRVLFASAALSALAGSAASAPNYTLMIRGGMVYDGSGGAPYAGDVAIAGDRIAAIGPHLAGRADKTIDARGMAVAPGFINMLAHPEESILVDGRAQSDLRQGVTLEVLGEDSMGPLSPRMKADLKASQGDLKYDIDWTTLGEYLDSVQRRGISVNIASFVSAETAREYVLGQGDVQPDPAQLAKMRDLIRQGMEDGALGVTTALMYVPATFAKTPELIDLAKESGRCGGMYIAHIRNEGDRLLESIDETIEIAKASGAPAEIYHFKQAGRDNWNKLDPAIARIEAARAAGTRITADMYVYVASATGLDASMPPWVQAGGIDAWIARLKDPATRARVAAEMDDPHPAGWDNAFGGAGPEGILLLGFKTAKLKPLAGKTLAEVARMRGRRPRKPRWTSSSRTARGSRWPISR